MSFHLLYSCRAGSTPGTVTMETIMRVVSTMKSTTEGEIKEE
jgi:hypothetical protein